MKTGSRVFEELLGVGKGVLVLDTEHLQAQPYDTRIRSIFSASPTFNVSTLLDSHTLTIA